MSTPIFQTAMEREGTETAKSGRARPTLRPTPCARLLCDFQTHPQTDDLQRALNAVPAVAVGTC